MVELTDKPLDAAGLLESVTSPQAGAAVLFVGTTREFTRGQQTLWLDYAGYDAMALRELEGLEAAARARWPLVGCAIVHRLGRVELAEASVAVAVSTPHRADAFAAAQWLMDELKRVVPIWKQEHWADGSTAWVHPGVERGATP